MSKKLKYYGWIVREANKGFRDSFWAEYQTEDGVRVLGEKTHSPVPVLEWWDRKVGQPVKLIETPLGAYRVYTEE